MQIDCYMRNWLSSVCIAKCKFKGECLAECVKRPKRKCAECRHKLTCDVIRGGKNGQGSSVD